MTKKWTAALALCVAVSAGATIGMLSGEAGQLPASEQQTNIKMPVLQKKAQYRLKGYEGKLAVYIIGKQTPEIIFDVYLNHLPDIDRMKLEEGIDIEEYSELLRLIEDYTS